jgi:hypothetical protein
MQNTLSFRSFAFTLAALGSAGCAASSPAPDSAVEAKEVPAPSDPDEQAGRAVE